MLHERNVPSRDELSDEEGEGVCSRAQCFGDSGVGPVVVPPPVGDAVEKKRT